MRKHYIKNEETIQLAKDVDSIFENNLPEREKITAINSEIEELSAKLQKLTEKAKKFHDKIEVRRKKQEPYIEKLRLDSPKLEKIRDKITRKLAHEVKDLNEFEELGTIAKDKEGYYVEIHDLLEMQKEQLRKQKEQKAKDAQANANLAETIKKTQAQ